MPLVRAAAAARAMVGAAAAMAILSAAARPRLRDRPCTEPGPGPGPGPGPPSVAEVYVLTINTPLASRRLRGLTASMEALGLTSFRRVIGMSFRDYKTEAAEMDQKMLPMTIKEKSEWQEHEERFDAKLKGLGAEQRKANGALACSLGHRHIWEMASEALAGQQGGKKRWAVILEDDARSTGVASLEQVLEAAPDEADVVFLENRHCQGRRGLLGTETTLYGLFGSTGYAVTAKGAQALLSERFDQNSDHWLNVPLMHGKMKGYCPADLAVSSGDPNESEIHPGASASLIEKVVEVDHFVSTRVVRRKQREGCR